MDRRRTLAVLLSGLAIVTLSASFGCATVPSADRGRYGAPVGLSLPIAARVALQVDPSMPASQTVEFRDETWRYAEPALMQQAAEKVFGQIFSEVGPLQTVRDPWITLQLNGSSSVNPVLGEYYANASATLFAGAATDDEPFGSFPGTGQAILTAPPAFAPEGIVSAYEAAFRQVVELLLADPQVLAALQGD